MVIMKTFVATVMTDRVKDAALNIRFVYTLTCMWNAYGMGKPSLKVVTWNSKKQMGKQN